MIVDLDGVVWRGGHAIDGSAAAVSALRASGTRVVFLTNDPRRSAAEFAARLVVMGIPAGPTDVITSGAATARYLAASERFRGAAAFVIGSPALHDELSGAGFSLVAAEAAREAGIVVVGGHEGFDYSELRAAATAVRNGAALFATGRDAVFPTRDGPWPATGSVLAAVETAAGVTATVIGKPEPYVFEIARAALTGCDRVAVVGDHLTSDVTGAKRAGLDAVLVLTGTTSLGDLEGATPQPDAVFESLAAFAAEA